MTQSPVQLPSVVARRIHHPSLGMPVAPIEGWGMAVPGRDPRWWLKDSCVWPLHTERRLNSTRSQRLFQRVKGFLPSLFSKHIYQPERGYDPAARQLELPTAADWG